MKTSSALTWVLLAVVFGSAGTLTAREGLDEGTHTLEGLVKLRWESRLPFGGNRLSVSADGERVVVANDRSLYVLDAATGTTSWDYSLPSDYIGIPPMAFRSDGTMVMGRKSHGAIAARDTMEGTLHWTRGLGDLPAYEWWDPCGWWREWSDLRVGGMSYSVDGDTLFLLRSHWRKYMWHDWCNWESGRGIRWSSHYLYGLDASTGAQIWQMAVPENTSAIDRDEARLFHFPPRSRGITAIDPDTGALLWSGGPGGAGRHFSVGSSLDDETVVVHGTACRHWWRACTDPRPMVYSVDGRMGNLLWSYEMDLDDSISDAAANSAVVVLSATRPEEADPFRTDAVVMGVSAQIGTVDWATRFDGSDGVADSANVVRIDPSGKQACVAATLSNSATGQDIALLGLDLDSAEERFRAQYAGPGPVDDESLALELSPDGSTAYLVGRSGDETIVLGYWMTFEIDVDIQPGDDANLIDLGNPYIVRVAILGSESFDVESFEPSTLRFGPAGAEPAEDLARPLAGQLPGDVQYELPDVNHDGYPDLIVPFFIQQTGIECGDSEATLTGKFPSGRPFEGVDAVRTEGCN